MRSIDVLAALEHGALDFDALLAALGHPEDGEFLDALDLCVEDGTVRLVGNEPEPCRYELTLAGRVSLAATRGAKAV